MNDPMTYHLPVSLTWWQVAALLLLQLLLTDVSCLPAKYRCQEELAEGSFVADISAGIDGSTVGYSIFRTVPNVSDMFHLDANSGRLTVGRRRLDREAICPQRDSCAVVMDVAISNNSVLSHIVKVEVTVDDVNDNEPRFGDVIVRKSLLESTPRSLVLELSPAVDPDSPANGVSAYHLDEETDGPFRLDVDQNRITNTVGLRLFLTGQLDREKVNRYDLRVKAVDAGQPPRTGVVTVEIDVADVNDNGPRFASAIYEATLDSDAPAGTTVIQVTASDPDEGTNGQVRYYLAKRSRALYGGVFEVREDSGEVVTARRLNETGTKMLASYRLDVVAEDRGEGAIPTQTSVRIRTKSVNRMAPAIRISAAHPSSNLSSLSVVRISENNLPMAFVCHVTVGDDDIGPSGQVTCSLDVGSEDDFRLVSMGEKKFKVVALRSFDREAKDLHALTLTCADLGTPPMTSQERFVVRIDDVDDNQPRFVRSEYDCSVVENAAAGAPLVRVQAVDPDEGLNGEVEYSLGSDADSRIFRIDVRTGDLFVLGPLDREATDSYEFHVRARSSKVRAVNSAIEVTCLVHVTVLDVDDERPRFQNATYKFKVAENENSGTEVGRVKAVDLDLPPNDGVVYRLEFLPEDHVTAASFAIDPVLGIVYTRKVLDRETLSHHTMRIVTTDPRDVSNATGGDVTIVFVEVDDVNDNAPVVTYPTAGDDAVHLVRNASSGRRRNVANLTAYDRDVGPNADLRYSIVSGNDDRRSYSLDPRTGSLFWTPEAATTLGADRCADVIDFVVRDNGFPVSLTSSARLFVFFDCEEEEEEDEEDGDEISIPFGDIALGHNGPSLFFVVLIMALVLLILLFVVVVAKVGGRRRRSDHVIGSKDGGMTAAFDVAAAARYQGDVNRGSDETLSGLVIIGDAQLDNCSRENEKNEQKKIPAQVDEIDESTSGNERDNDSGCVDVSAVETKEQPPRFQIHFNGSESGLSSRCHSN